MRTLYPHQRVAVDHLAASSRFLLSDEMGLGKTTSALVAAERVMRSYDCILVAAPTSVIWNWKAEAHACLPWTQDVDVQVLDSAKKRMRGRPTVLITTHGLLRKPEVQVNIRLLQPRIMILDEAHYLRTPTAQMTKSWYGLVHELRPAFAWNLTGTPQINWPADLWTWLHSYHTDRFPESYADFVDYYHLTRETDYGTQIVAVRNLSSLKKRMKGLYLGRRTSSVIDLPPLRHERFAVHVDPTAEATDASAALAAQLAVADTDEERLAVLLEHGGMSKFRRWCGQAKAEPVASMIQDELVARPDQPKVVFYQHTAVADTIAARFEDCARISGDTPAAERERIVKAFQAGELDVLLCQLQAASTGITLTHGRDVIFAEQSWSPGEMLQAAKRCHRIGQKNPVRIRYVYAEGTVDDLVTAVLARKMGSMTEVWAEE